jgi:hypothetical protein
MAKAKKPMKAKKPADARAEPLLHPLPAPSPGLEPGPPAENNEARKVFDAVASTMETEGVSQSFIRSHLFSFITSPGRASDEIGQSNRSFLNGVCYLGLVAALLTFSAFFFQMVFAETKVNTFNQTIGLVVRLITGPLSAMIYDSVFILIVFGIALFMKNISLKKMTERPYMDNFFNSMAFTGAVTLIAAIPFSSLLAMALKGASDIDADTRNTLMLLAANIGLALMVWQLVLMYLVSKKYLGLEAKHALIALIPMAIPLLNSIYLLMGELSKMSGT